MMNAPVFRVQEAARGDHAIARRIAEAAAAIAGIACIGGALAAYQAWLDRHFLPSFLLPRDLYVRVETSVRAALAVVGVLCVLFVRPRLGAIVARAPARTLHVAIAALIALAASEPVLRHIHLQPAEW